MSLSPETIVDLNVSGVNYTTSVSTLTADPDSLLGERFSGRSALPAKDSQGRYFIDRDGQLFRFVLDYLRNGKILLLPESFAEFERLKREAAYYRLPGLAAACVEQQQQRLPAATSTACTAAVGGGKPGYISVGYRGSFAFGRDNLSDIKFRKLTRILVAGKVSLCREVFTTSLNESRDPDNQGIIDRYTARFFLKHTQLEMCFDNLLEAGFRCVGSAGSATNHGGTDALKPGVDIEESKWNHFNEYVFVRP